MPNPVLKPSANPTLVQSLLKGVNRASGWEAVQDAIGLGKHLVTKGLPESIRMNRGRYVLTDSDVESPETVGNVISVPADVTDQELEHEFGGPGSHAAQGDVLGPAMILARPMEMAYPYGQGPLEHGVFSEQEPDNPISKRKSPGIYQRGMESLLNALLGTGRK